MQAVVVHEPGGPEVLSTEERPVPEAEPGRVLVRVHAFGLNRPELITRAGGSGDAVRFPRILGIECAGEVVEAPGSDLRPGQRVISMMGGMGRDFDGGYAQYALPPADRVIPVDTGLDWPELGAIPESYGTAWGSLQEIGLCSGQSLLVHGGSSSVGMDAISLAKERGITVLATTRQEDKRAALERAGADHVLVLDGEVAPAVREIVPDGVDGLCELVGPTAMAKALQAVKPGGRSCITGFLEGDWDTEPADREAGRVGVELRRFGSGVINRDDWTGVFHQIVGAVEADRMSPNVDRVFPMSEIVDAHRYMEENRAAGKVVVLPPED
jgi:NADPH:quinone reductase-like Zn-dependent oxidoreductase